MNRSRRSSAGMSHGDNKVRQQSRLPDTSVAVHEEREGGQRYEVRSDKAYEWHVDPQKRCLIGSTVG